MPQQPMFLSLSQQVTQYLRKEIDAGRWGDELPGRHALAAELGVSHKTVQVALRALELEGLVVAHGAGRNRKVLTHGNGEPVLRLRVGFFLWAETDRSWAPIVHLQHELEESGHCVIDPRMTLTELHMKVNRIAALVHKHPADAWVVVAGSLEVLQWFRQQEFSTFAIYGRNADLSVSSVATDSRPSIITQITNHLIELGHRRIAMLVRSPQRLPQPSSSVQAFIEALEVHGIAATPYHIPNWEETLNGFQECLSAMFRVTPPTALIVDEPQLYITVNHFLAHRGISVPSDVSLVCVDASPAFDWCVPTVAQVFTDHNKLIRPVLRWVNRVARGQSDIRKTIIEMKYLPGGTVGTAKP